MIVAPIWGFVGDDIAINSMESAHAARMVIENRIYNIK
jgi:hypothetical protein